VSALTFNYGQRHAQEIESARRIVKAMKVKEHRIININLREIGGSALTDEIEVPHHQPIRRGIPITYVPARNTIFLSYALGWAEVLGISDVFIGANALDYSGYPDCRPEYLKVFEKMANLATRAAVEGKRFKLHAPLINLTKAEIIRKGLSLRVDYSLTHSCYAPSPEGKACGQCDSCQLRRKGFREAGVKDPLAARKL
ncbi:7-cyano-7-deazaguanine synthase QueC, partial [candidate division NPL-UPA2 bacterium]|nr:7-cyano-7-deazaguanine synthase QueC [candidate division NPL-UPA2 bacterium]